MNRIIPILSIVLLVQVVLSIALFSFGNKNRAFATDEKFINLALESVDRIRIEDGDKQSVTMVKKENRWLLPDLYDFPVSAEKLDRVMNKLLNTGKGWPVATTAGAAKRFKVSKELFERRIDFDKGERTLKTLFIGTSPGFKKVHARLSGQNDVYAIDFSAFEASSKAGDWSDKNFLNLNQSDITRIQLPSVEIGRQDGTLAVADPGDGKESDSDAVANLARKLANLTFRSVLGTEEKPEYNLSKPVLRFTLTLKEGDAITYAFGQQKGEKDFILKTSAHPYFFKVAQYTVDGIKQTTKAKLVRDKTPKASPSDQEEQINGKSDEAAGANNEEPAQASPINQAKQPAQGNTKKADPSTPAGGG